MQDTCAGSNTICLTVDEKETIRNALIDICYDPNGGGDYIHQLRKVAYRDFPDRILKSIEALREDSASYYIFDNLPVDEVFGSPQDDADSLDFKTGYLSENVLVALGSLIAEPYSIRHEGPKLVNDLVPHLGALNDYTGNGSELELDLHTENAFQAYDPRGDTSPLALLLFGVRSDPSNLGPKTWVADAREALGTLDKRDLELLCGKHFVIRQPYRWRSSSAKSDETHLYPIVNGPLTYPRVTAAFYPDMVVAVNPEAEQALVRFYHALKRIARSVDIQPGKLVFISNRYMLHSRDRFTPSFDSQGHAYRWVQRLFITNSLWNFRSFSKSGSRIFDPVAQ